MAASPPLSATALEAERAEWPPGPTLPGFVLTLGLVGLVTLTVHLGRDNLPASSWPLIFLVAVLLPAVVFGFWTGLLAALASFAALNYLFTEPLYTFHIAQPQDLIALLVFLLVAGLAGFLAGRLHDRAEAARHRASTLTVLAALAADLAAADSVDQVLTLATHHLAALTGGQAAALESGTAPDLSPRCRVAVPAALVLSTADLQAAERSLRLRRAEVAAAAGWAGAALTFLPLSSGTTALVLGHLPVQGSEGPRSTQAIEALVEQVRLALDRLTYADHARTERLRAETEVTRSALLASLSHDLRTPLATILGAASTLQDLDASLTAPARADLLTAIVEEATRLNRHVTNLLQMTRLESGMLAHLAWVDLADVAGAAVARARRAWPGAAIHPDLPAGLPMIRAEAGLLEQAIFNLIDNGLHHGSPPVIVQATATPGALGVRVADAGTGVPDAIGLWLAGPDLHPPAGGRGLGLAVAKGIARLHGGTLTASPGAILLTLPLPT